MLTYVKLLHPLFVQRRTAVTEWNQLRARKSKHVLTFFEVFVQCLTTDEPQVKTIIHWLWRSSLHYCNNNVFFPAVTELKRLKQQTVLFIYLAPFKITSFFHLRSAWVNPVKGQMWTTMTPFIHRAKGHVTSPDSSGSWCLTLSRYKNMLLAGAAVIHFRDNENTRSTCTPKCTPSQSDIKHSFDLRKQWEDLLLLLTLDQFSVAEDPEGLDRKSVV